MKTTAIRYPLSAILVLALTAFHAFGQVGGGVFSGPATTLSPAQLATAGVAASNYITSFTIKPVGAYTDHLTVFTNLQECFNVISNTAMSYAPIVTNKGFVFTEPMASYSIHLDNKASCYAPGGFYLNIKQNCFINLEGDLGCRIIGDSNVLITAGRTDSGSSVMRADISGIQFICMNPFAKTMMVYVYSETLNLHDNIFAPYQVLTNGVNLANNSGIYGSGVAYPNPVGIIGFVGFGEHGRQVAERNFFTGMAVPIIAAYPHWTIRDNECQGTSIYTPSLGAAGIFSNAWSAADTTPISIPGNTLDFSIYGWECALGVDIIANAYSGNFTITGNHLTGGIYLDDRSSPNLGPISIYYNTFETASALGQNLITSSNNIVGPIMDYWGNEKGSGSSRGNQRISAFVHADLMTISNLYLSIFTNTAGVLDPTLNGAFKLKSASTTLNSATDFNTATAIWTNLANTDAAIYLNPPGADDGGGIYTSNTSSGNMGFFAPVDQFGFNGFVNMPITPANLSYGFFADNAGGSSVAGNLIYGTNVLFRMRPTYNITNYQVMDGAIRMRSNGISFFLSGSGTWSTNQ